MASVEDVREALKTVNDPEVGVNVVDLGLVYDIEVNGERVNVKMTLTTPGCPLSDYIGEEAQKAVLSAPGVEHADIDMVWDPPWTPELITDEGRRALSELRSR